MAASILTFGEMLVDVPPSGARPGGAPFNCATHLASLGSEVAIASAVGDDATGEELIATGRKHGVDMSLVQRRQDLATSRVEVSFDADNEPSYDIVAPCAWDDIRETPELRERVEACRVLVYGALGIRDARSRATLYTLLDLPRSGATPRLHVMDPTLRPPHFERESLERMLEAADIVKLNQDELTTIARVCGLHGDTAAVLAEAYGLDTVVVTEGAKGAYSLREDGSTARAEAPSVEVVDTVGAGDAFLAAYLHERFTVGADEAACLRAACARGAFVATLAGALPPTADA